MTQRRVTRGHLAVFAGALVGVPAIMLGVLVTQAIEVSDHELREVLGPAAVGATLGVVLIAIRRLRAAQPGARLRGEGLGSAIIVTAALVGTFSDLLPRSVDAFLSGLFVGLFVALDVYLVKLWRSDPRFRDRIRTIADPRDG